MEPFGTEANAPLRVGSRRWFLQAGMSGIGGLALAPLLGLQYQASAMSMSPATDGKSVILFWLSGGPSHIDM